MRNVEFVDKAPNILGNLANLKGSSFEIIVMRQASAKIPHSKGCLFGKNQMGKINLGRRG